MKTGFTLIEILIVTALVAILAALAYPSYAGYIVKVRRSEAQVALLDTMQRQERYYADNNRYLPFSADSDNGGTDQFKWWSGRSARESAYELRAQACPGMALNRCIEVQAMPGTGRVDGRFRDRQCETLTLTSNGDHRASGPGPRCWP
ncbi:type IV pilin protein [Massilia sp. CF038]|uniref:type IV pilin protein n=1 Tax=Massilia sp. CF038 TaxID=1881045 RepID=UPI00091923DE|nr:type IV pilin protein [Massilia sp. CF038]SHH11389.1 type IV pilus assembly protein PilE [Massilia sp. CF038]